MSISKTVDTWAEVRFESTMCSAVFRRIGDIGTTCTREPAAGGGTAEVGAGVAGVAAVGVDAGGAAAAPGAGTGVAGGGSVPGAPSGCGAGAPAGAAFC